MAAGYGYDMDRSLLVVVRDHTESDAEYEDFLKRIERLDHDAHARGQEPVFIVVTGPKTPAPNAHWRRRIADLSATARSQNIFAGIVTQSSIQRGVVNAIRWLQPQARGLAAAFPTFEGACLAAERYRHERLPELPRLYNLAKDELARRWGRIA